jgi:thioredoxin 1
MDIAVKYNILSIPTLGFFRGGEMVDRIVGAVPKRAIVEKISKTFVTVSGERIPNGLSEK